MSETTLNEDTAETLIDAEFEPATPAPVKPQSRGPGWLSFCLLALLGITALGLHFYPGDAPAPIEDPTDTSQTLAALQTALDSSSARQDELANTLAQVRSDMQTLAQTPAALDALEIELTEIYEQIDTVARAAPSPSSDMGANTAEETAPSVDLAPLTRRLLELESQIALISKPAPTNGVETPFLSDIETQIEAISDAQAELEQRLLALEETLTTLPMLQADSRLKDAALAFAAIENAARRGDAFITAYTRLSDALPDDADVRTLRPYASAPPSSWRTLRNEFASHAQTAQSQQSDSTTPGWFQNLVGDGIRVRRTDSQSATAQFTAAAQALDGETPADAIALIEALEADIQAPFTVWLQQARARQDLDEALNRLRQTLLFEDRP